MGHVLGASLVGAAVRAGAGDVLRPLAVVAGRTSECASVDFDRPGSVGSPASIGVLSGLVGAGGAFLLMPGLVGKLVPFGPTLAAAAGSLGGATFGARLGRRARSASCAVCWACSSR